MTDPGNYLNWGGRSGLSASTQGAVMIAAMNAMGYDVAGIGPSDLELGLELLQTRLAEAEFAVACANVRAAGQPLGQEIVTLERAGLRVAVVGLCGELRAPVDGVEWEDPTAVITPLVLQARAQANLVMLLSTLGPVPEQELVAAVPGIDLVVGGGSGIPEREVRWVGQTALVRAGGLGEYLGVTEVTGAEVITTALQLGPDFPDDPAMVDLMRRFEDEAAIP